MLLRLDVGCLGGLHPYSVTDLCRRTKINTNLDILKSLKIRIDSSSLQVTSVLESDESFFAIEHCVDFLVDFALYVGEPHQVDHTPKQGRGGAFCSTGKNVDDGEHQLFICKPTHFPTKVII